MALGYALLLDDVIRSGRLEPVTAMLLDQLRAELASCKEPTDATLVEFPEPERSVALNRVLDHHADIIRALEAELSGLRSAAAELVSMDARERPS